MGEYEAACDAVLAEQEKWISCQEAEERERELEEEREREREREREKKEVEERHASACQVAQSLVGALAADPKTCICCARLGKLLVILVIFLELGSADGCVGEECVCVRLGLTVTRHVWPVLPPRRNA